jgi:hypothetical protein
MLSLRDATNNGTRMFVMWGLGGASKMLLVLDYVQQHRDEYKAAFWIEAERKELLEVGCFRCDAIRLCCALSIVSPVSPTRVT